MKWKFARAALVSVGFAAWPSAPAATPLQTAAGNNPQLLPLATYVGVICPKLVELGFKGTSTPQGDLQRRCAAALNAAAIDPSGAKAALGQIAPEQIIGQDASISGSVMRNTSAISSRLSAMSRFGGPSAQLALLSRPIQLAELEGDAPSAAASALAPKKLQTFGTFTYSGGHQDRTTLESGFGIDFKSGTVGADYRFTPAITAGLSFGYGRTTLDFRQDAGSLKSRALTFGAYGLVEASDRLELSGLFAYNDIRYRSNRTLDYTLPATPKTPIDIVSASALGRTNARQFELQGGASYNLGHGAWTFGPALQLDWSRLSIDAFDESNAAGLGFHFPDQHATSFLIAIGGDVSRAISTSSAVVQPYGRARVIFEASDKRRSIPIRYVADTNGVGFTTLTTTATDRTRFSLDGGINAQFQRGFSAFVDAGTLLGLANVTQYTFSVGVRLEL